MAEQRDSGVLRIPSWALRVGGIALALMAPVGAYFDARYQFVEFAENVRGQFAVTNNEIASIRSELARTSGAVSSVPIFMYRVENIEKILSDLNRKDGIHDDRDAAFEGRLARVELLVGAQNLRDKP